MPLMSRAVDLVRRRPGAVLAWVLGLHLVVWTLVPILVCHNLQLDLVEDLALGKGYPTPYQRFALGPVRPERPAAKGWLFAAGELAMTASDLAKWDIARMNRAWLPADDWQTQETSIKLADGKDTGY